jgi:hypothetical protein
MDGMTRKESTDLSGFKRRFFEALSPASETSTGTVPLSTTPSVSPPALEPPARSWNKLGRQRGSKVIWRCEPLQAERDDNHYPTLCAACATPLEMWDRQSGHSAHFVLDLKRTTGDHLPGADHSFLRRASRRLQSSRFRAPEWIRSFRLAPFLEHD